jgi:ABC-type nitrate/sulfonate/bicarbonate transport system permease component
MPSWKRPPAEIAHANASGGRQIGLAARPAMKKARAPFADPVRALRLAIILAVLAGWEALARSGLLFQDVVPSLIAVGAALGRLLADPLFWSNLGVTALEVALAVAIGGGAGLAAGIVIGGSRFLTRAYEPFLYYLGPTPKIIFFPVMIMWFGVGIGSKVAMGALSCFFPVALSTAAGMRQIDRVLIDVGRSFRARPLQMVAKIYLPAMVAPVVNGLRLGLGVAIIGTLLAETKLSNKGLGFLIIQSYQRFDMPEMYAILIVVFTLAALINASFAANGKPISGR